MVLFIYLLRKTRIYRVDFIKYVDIVKSTEVFSLLAKIL